MFQVEQQPEYEDVPSLPPRSDDLIEEEEEPEQIYSECDPDPIPQDQDYEDIGLCTTAGLTLTIYYMYSLCGKQV